MAAKPRPTGRSLKSYATYTTTELAAALGVHSRTIANWRGKGLEAIDATRPLLFKGADVKAFLTNTRKARRRPCRPGELFCLSCQKPRRCAGGMADLLRLDEGSCVLSIVALCEVCETKMHRFVKASDVPRVCADLDVAERVGPNAYPGSRSAPEFTASTGRDD